ncbi:MAG: imidazole glycerol phosphate synthase subunit HisF [Alphaproteobacteria bacterium RIFCSPLOWO2_01_FULL_40_26]|nr:MAG: imidazole glycerol phosphate synthase subunit HisF [Alphaproteobacteria bacterium RIFCSPHIGHO2_02_FULL_40_34]OFW86043.1 MAG: imidazole glycerol phosphate synthase subunit HisF [Alphaproteobacteria bacterium RIFCSPHIGHO2_01_FULL_40_8]OFW95187.1 MAG: imidazole glycerol phosphate synthase subunit HisF [Alphaproteobacteria bacterium RIFCSPLOWO2_01_FULL_40_26]OFX09978.1 MAG: imidazole glycerol phosphate synthase subunit HisF [Alphaproteobacteria bacterium RIFCSPLOWO2_02_FULL_40_19]OFX12328.1
MLKNRIIPCLDVKNGRVVKGINFENLVDAGDPVMQAKFYYEEGADELCFLDIAASQENRGIMLDMVKKVAQVCFIPFTVGGGIKELQDFSDLLKCGADKVSINSAAIKNPELITQASEKFGAQAVVVAIDAKKNSSENYEIFTHGGKKPTGIDAINWAIKAEKLGAGELLITSINRDGTKAGYDLELIKTISSQVSIPIIASGGVGNLEHMADGLKAGASAVLAASIFHFKTYSIRQAKEFLQHQNIAVKTGFKNSNA